MTVVKLFQIGDLQQEPVAVFDDGEYTVGRGPVNTIYLLFRILELIWDRFTVSNGQEDFSSTWFPKSIERYSHAHCCK